MHTICGKFTNFFHDTTMWSAVQQMVTGVERHTMAEAVDEAVATLRISADWVYWNTLVEMDGPGGHSIVVTVDLTAHIENAMRRTASPAPAVRAMRAVMPTRNRAA